MLCIEMDIKLILIHHTLLSGTCGMMPRDLPFLPLTLHTWAGDH
jgi:hypothetical protein